MFYFFHSNRYEILRKQLLDELCQTRRDGGVFDRSVWITSSPAIADDVTRALAQREGIALNLETCFLTRWLWREMGRAMPSIKSQAEHLTTPAMSWHIFKLLRESSWSTFERLHQYLTKADDAMQFELAQQLAQLFDLYLLSRPEWLQSWQQEPKRHCLPSSASHTALADERWQAALWQRLAKNIDLPSKHPAMQWLDDLKNNPANRAKLPRKVRIFCLPTIVPQYRNILHTLSQWIDIHLYALNPCEEYWFDLVDKKRLQRLEKRSAADGFEVLNPLLATLGKQSQVYLAAIFEQLTDYDQEHGQYTPTPNHSLLARIQNRLLQLNEDTATQEIDAQDRSIEIHCCHSLSRELEVLHDTLLELLSADPSLSASDIVIGLPDLAAATPQIEAVFGASAKAVRLPWQISGQPKQQNAVAQLLTELMQWLDSHMLAKDFMALLHNPLLTERFALSNADVLWLHDALDSAGARWGLNTQQVQALDLPAQAAANSLHAALNRLLLAWVWGEADDQHEMIYFADCTPAGNPNGISDTQRLGVLVSLLESIERFRAFAAQTHTIEQWCEAIRTLIAALVSATPERLDAIAAVHSILAKITLEANQSDAFFKQTTKIPFKVFRLAFAAAGERSAAPASATGNITFAPIGALRNLPAAVICLLGLNEDIFPGNSCALEFDLTAAAPRADDSNRSNENRGIFLDCLLAARKRLHLSWSGQDIRDNSERAPSSVITALLDEIGRCCKLDAETLNKRFCVQHRLQAFAAEYFLPAEQKPDARLLSFRAQYAVRRGADAPTAFFSATPTEAPAAPVESNNISARDLIHFWQNPARAFLHHQFSLSLHNPAQALPTAELFVADYDAERTLARQWLPLLIQTPNIADTPPTSWLQSACASAHYPSADKQWLHEQYVQLSALAKRIRSATHDQAEQLHKLHITLPNGVIGGLLTGLYPSGLVLYRNEKCNIRDQLGAWLNHLMLCAAAPENIDLRTQHIGKDCTFFFTALTPQNARAQLESLLAYYQQGLTQAFAFFPKSAAAFMQTFRKKTPTDSAAIHAHKQAAYLQAIKIWRNSDWPECEDRFIRFLWRDHPDPLAQMLREGHALEILNPLFDAMQEA